MDNEAIIVAFADWQRAAARSENTVKERTIRLRALAAATGKSFLAVTRFDLLADLGRRELSPRTRQNYRSFYHLFFTWLQDEGFRPDNPAVRLPRVHAPKPEANPLTTEDLQLLVNSGVRGRTRMYILLYAYQGFRPVEIAAVSSSSVDLAHHRILSAEGKGGRQVWRPLHPLVEAELRKHLRDGWLFPSATGEGHITRKNVSNVLSKAMKRAGLIGHRPHNLRAWFATEQLEAGVPQLVVQANMRHVDGQSIERYVRPSERAMRDALARLPEITLDTAA